METTQRIRERIFNAADELYAEADRTQFPTVDAVRRRARVNMNDASSYMKEWRRARTEALTPESWQPPDQLRAGWSAVLAQLWQQAVHCAGEPLRVARAEWEAERSRAQEAEREFIQAFDQQTAELETAHDEIERLRNESGRLNDDVAKATTAVVAAEQATAAATVAAREAQVRVAEIERRAEELRKELDHAHDEVVQLRASHADEITRMVSDTKNEISREREKGEQAQQRHDTSLASLRIEIAEMRAALATTARNPTASKRKATPANKATHGGGLF